jgi:acetyl esterase/lipase
LNSALTCMPHRVPRAAPLILVVHGGGWIRGDKEMGRVNDSKVSRWLPRYLRQHQLPHAAQGATAGTGTGCGTSAGLRRENSARLGVDRSNIVLMGHSAGAHLIALLAARPELLDEAGAKTPLGFVLLDSGALDVPAIMNARHFRLTTGPSAASRRTGWPPLPSISYGRPRRRFSPSAPPAAKMLARKPEPSPARPSGWAAWPKSCRWTKRTAKLMAAWRRSGLHRERRTLPRTAVAGICQ